MWKEDNLMNEADADGGDGGGGDAGAADTGDADAVAAALAVGGDAAAATDGERDEAKTWALADGVDGEGDAPEWFKGDKYKSVSEQAKAYNELEGKFGSFTGAPDEYGVFLSDELKEQGIEIAADDPIMEEAMKFAKDSSMNQEGFNNMVNLYAMTKIAENNAMEESKVEEIKSLGANAQTRLDNLSKWGKANMSDDQYAGFEEMLTTASSVQAVERLISMTRAAPLSPDGVQKASSVSSEELKAMQFEKDEHGNRRIQTDPDFKARYNKLKGEVWGADDHNVIVG